MHVILQSKNGFDIDDFENPTNIEIVYGSDGKPSVYKITKGGSVSQYSAAAYHIAILGG